MEELFRFVAIRSADAVEADDPQIATKLDADSNFRKGLLSSKTQKLRETDAQAFVSSDGFVDDLKKIDHGPAMIALADRFRDTKIGADPGLEQVLDQAVETLAAHDSTFRSTGGDTAAKRAEIAEYTRQDSWREMRTRVADSLLALRETRVQSRDIPALADAVKATEILLQLANEEVVSVKPGSILASAIFLNEVRETETPDEPEGSRRPGAAEEEPGADVGEALAEILRAPDGLLEFQQKIERFDPRRDNTQPTRGDPNPDDDGGVEVTRVPVLARNARAVLSEKTQKTLSSLDLDPTSMPLGDVAKTLRFVQKNAQPKAAKARSKSVFGTKLPAKAIPNGILAGSVFPEYLKPWLPVTKGHVSPAGVGDLHIVRQQLKRYQGGDLAHIENVLQGESKEREHRRRRYSEVEFTSETEVAVSEERETQTTERFELGLETKRLAESELGVGADVKVSASYGPTVQVEANTNFSYKNAKSESQSRSVQMSKEVVEKAAAAYSEKVREQQRRKLIEEVEETNSHSLNAENAPGHVTGVYQWIDKVYEAQVYNYGRRVMYDFMVPEPAAWYIWALSRRAESETGGIAAPPPFDISPADITEGNYEGLVATFEAKDVGPPPEPFVSVAYSGSGGPNPEKGPVVGSDTITLPADYQYAGHSEYYRYTAKSNDQTRGFTLKVSTDLQTPGQIPIIFSGHSLTGWSAMVHVLARRTDNAMEAWRQEVWNALHDGHRQQTAEYEEKLAQLMAQEGVEIQGRNPGYNRKLEAIELKKSCIALLSGSYPHWLNSMIETSGGPIPSLSKSATQGGYVRFIEQAFEWENLTYIFYPYYWARSSEWEGLMAIEDVDPFFLDFLTAGFARVVVPVRPGFESVAEHFRQTGKVWLGGKMPTITDPDYLPIAEEMKAAQGAGGEEEPIGEPWDVVVPTQLVKLRDDNGLPEWVKQPDGTWAEA